MGHYKAWAMTGTKTANAVAYVRVSTQGQARSGLGLEAQRDAIAAFAKAEGFEIGRAHV